MKHTLTALFLLLPVSALAYPDPNVPNGQSAGDIVDTVLPEPSTGPVVATTPTGTS